ncbi:lantibiotic dehydratase [Moritella yayanosii]|uniref:Lantibiotic dehydratase N-terminal domain-containing protein n=1 Tax=Moritella yayanosii TaxID=69539 RepID=A0A330LYD3_9GAMM|nr:lantibiotic dehydratase [Moritella yayanosii]SQD80708.1 conserved protein of unknown function, containing conserved domain of Lantibiotic dehydratase, C-terminal [Moritella yayanosii]
MKCSDYFWLRSTGFEIEELISLTDLPNLPHFNDYYMLVGQAQTIKANLKTQLIEFGEQSSRNFLRKLNDGEQLSIRVLPVELRGKLGDATEQLNQLQTTLAKMKIDLDSDFSKYTEQTRQRLIDFLDQPEISEALFISNPEACKRIKSLVEGRAGFNDSRKKQKIRLGWSYAQRFCTKNDTCSFFGPITWGQFLADQDALVEVNHAEGNWLRSRKTFFESWVIQRIIGQLNEQCPDANKVPLMLNTGCVLVDDVLFYPLEKSRQLSGDMLNIVRLLQHHAHVYNCDSLLAKLMIDNDVALKRLIDAGIIKIGFVLSPRVENPLKALADKLVDAKLPTDFTQQWLNTFTELESQREAYASGSLEQRQIALVNLNNLLSAANVSLSRSSGEMYVGRYPVYEDCSRDTQVSFNQTIKKHIEEDFTPLILLYQWLTRVTAYELHQHWLGVWSQCCSEYDTDELNILTFLNALKPLQDDIGQQVQTRITTVLQQSWGEILTTVDAKNENAVDSAEIQLTSDDFTVLMSYLNESCPDAQHFEVFGDAFHSPDFMLSASSQEALNAGDYHLIIGEVHPAVHTLSQPVAAHFSPFNQQINAEVKSLFSSPRLILADTPTSYQRSHIDWPIINNYQQLILPTGGGCVALANQFSAGRAQIVLVDGRLRVTDRLGYFNEDLLCVHNTQLHQLLFDLAGDIIPRHECRRILFNRSIYKRRTWSFESSDWPVSSKDELGLFVQWRLWKDKYQMPRWIFVKCDSEPKPFFVDFDNPLSLDALVSALKKAKVIRVSEMLPDPNALWFADKRGKFCAEIRTSMIISDNNKPVSSEQYE